MHSLPGALTRRAALSGVAASALASSPVFGKARRPVDVNLVLALDVSDSVKEDGWQVQRRGYATAFSNPEVQDAMLQGSIGCIGVVVVQWSSRMNQTQAVPWMVIDSREMAGIFSMKLAGMKRFFQENTAVGAAIEYCAEVLHFSPYEAMRSVIDISGDGFDNDPPDRNGNRVPLGMVRNEVATRYPRLTVNGLALLGAPDVKVDLLEYFENQVIFGPDSFAIAVEDPGNAKRFTEGLEKKLFKELVG